ncbi:MAG: amidohydrolase family protein [Deltaproteobacteria bacterium]|nr:amidohydrolase family protein [Deltaproteobacteria bacterium]
MQRRGRCKAISAGALGVLLALGAGCTKTQPRFPKAVHGFARIDTHMHLDPRAVDRTLALMDRWGIDGAINLSGMHPGPPRHALEMQLEAAAKTNGRVAVFMTPSFVAAVKNFPNSYGAAMAEQLAEGKRLGAIGLKITKGLGLGYPAPDMQTLLAVDDPGLDPLFEKAGELGMPVAIHTGDPKAFWEKPDESNERLDELKAHPGWSLHGEPVPSWQELLLQFEHRVARHPKTTFIGVHFGNAPEEPQRVAAMLDKYPNLFIDTAARVPAIGRHSAEQMRAFFIKYQDRILFATDTAVGPTQDEMMYGSNGAEPPTLADESRFFEQTYRYFETNEKNFEHPTAIQGRWRIDGLGLPDAVLKKLYFENAARVLHWRPGPQKNPPTPSLTDR